MQLYKCKLKNIYLISIFEHSVRVRLNQRKTNILCHAEGKPESLREKLKVTITQSKQQINMALGTSNVFFFLIFMKVLHHDLVGADWNEAESHVTNVNEQSSVTD